MGVEANCQWAVPTDGGKPTWTNATDVDADAAVEERPGVEARVVGRVEAAVRAALDAHDDLPGVDDLDADVVSSRRRARRRTT